MINNKLAKALIVGVLSSVLFVIFFLFGILSNIDKPLAEGDDTSLHYFIIEHNLSKLSKLDFSNYFDTRMFYPHKNTLALGNSLIAQSIMLLPVFLITKNAVMAANCLYIINPFLAFLTMYILAYYLTKSISGGIIAGLFYAYNPFVWAHTTQLELLTTQWIPLIFLVTELLIKKISIKLLIILGLLFLIQLNSGLYYLFFIILLWPLYLGIRLYLEKIPFSKFLPGLALLGILVVVGGIIFLRPQIEAKSVYKADTSLESVTLVSAKLTDFLFTSEKNKLYGWMVHNQSLRSIRDAYAAEYNSEHSLFPGITVVILFGLALFLIKKKKEVFENNKFIVAYFILLIISVILSFGPYIILGNIRIPSLYLLIFHIIPFADSFRAVSRFIVISNLSLAIIIALGWQIFSSSLNEGKRYLMAIMIITLICLEYQNQPMKAYPLNPEILQFYSWLEGQKNIGVIVEIPAANGLSKTPDLDRDFMSDAQYLLYGTIHTKKIVNGYHSYIPPDSVRVGNFLSVDFPNEDNLTLLKLLKVDIIIIHIDQYNRRSRGYNVISRLKVLDLKEVYKSENISAFSLMENRI